MSHIVQNLLEHYRLSPVAPPRAPRQEPSYNIPEDDDLSIGSTIASSVGSEYAEYNFENSTQPPHRLLQNEKIVVKGQMQAKVKICRVYINKIRLVFFGLILLAVVVLL